MARTWVEMHEWIPYLSANDPARITTVATGSDWSTSVAQPGRHSGVTRGGDFRVDVTSIRGNWIGRAFTHHDLLTDIYAKGRVADESAKIILSQMLARVIQNDQTADPTTAELASLITLPGIQTAALASATQLLSIAEHRRYGRYEPETGRYLPVRLALGILLRAWPVPSPYELSQGRRALTEYRNRYGAEPRFHEVFTQA